MSCNATRIELSNTATTTVQFTVVDTPDDGTVVSFQVPSLSISVSPTTTAGVASVTIPSVAATENDILDATLQVGTNAAVVAEVLVVETNEDQTIGVTISDAGVSYCAPTGGGGGGQDTPLINAPIYPNGGIPFLFEDATGVDADVQAYAPPDNQNTVQVMTSAGQGKPVSGTNAVPEPQWQTAGMLSSFVSIVPNYGNYNGTLQRLSQVSVQFNDVDAATDKGEPSKVFSCRSWGGPAVSLESIKSNWAMTSAEKSSNSIIVQQLQNSTYRQLSVGTSLAAKSMTACFNKATTSGVDGGTF